MPLLATRAPMQIMILRDKFTPLLRAAILDHRRPTSLAWSPKLHVVMPDFIVASPMTEHPTN
jgi:hypothetical protein